jgi:hypothetical protein
MPLKLNCAAHSGFLLLSDIVGSDRGGGRFKTQKTDQMQIARGTADGRVQTGLRGGSKVVDFETV